MTSSWNFNSGVIKGVIFCRLRVLRRKLRPNIVEVRVEWRRLHSEEPCALYSLPNIIRLIKSRRMVWAGHVARTGQRRGAYRILVWKPEGRKPLGRPTHRWEDNIK